MLITTFLISFSSREVFLRQKYQDSPAITAQYWGNKWKAKPLQQRITSAPEPLISHIFMENQLPGCSERPVAAEPSPEFFEALKSINSHLPEPVKWLAEERLIGIFIVNDLGSSGYTEAVSDGNGQAVASQWEDFTESFATSLSHSIGKASLAGDCRNQRSATAHH